MPHVAPLSRTHARSALLAAMAAGITAAFVLLSTLQAAQFAAPLSAYSPPPGNVLRIHWPAPATLDPALASSSSEAGIIAQVFESLVRLDENHEPQPALAGSWAVSPGGSVYTFTLQEAYFSNGRRIVAGDVYTSFMRVLSPALAAPYALMLDDIQGAQAYRNGNLFAPVGIQVLDDVTVRMSLVGPRAPGLFLKKLSLPAASIVPVEEVAAGGAQWWQSPAHYVGSGPFKMTEFAAGGQVVLAANPLYHAGLPTLSGIVYRVIADQNVAFNEYVAGNLDMYAPPQSQAISITLAGIRSQFYSETAVTTIWADLINQKAPFTGTAGTKLRQALSYAVDRTKLVSVTLGGTAAAARGLLPPSIYGYSPTLQGLDFNVVSATQRLAESGYSGSPNIVMYANPGTLSTLQNVRDQVYANLGISMSITSSASADYQVDRRGWVADYPDPEDWLAYLLRSNSALNTTGYNNPAFDALVDQAAQTITESERIALYQQAEQLAVSEAALLPLYYSRLYVLVKPWVKGPVIFDRNWSRPYLNISIESSAAISVGTAITHVADANVQLLFSPSALTQAAVITYTALPTRPASLAGGYDAAGYAFGLSGAYTDGTPVTSLQSPVTITINYSMPLPMREDTLALFSLSGGTWVPADLCGGPWIDTNANVFRAVLCHFSDYALVGKAGRLYLPAIRR